MGKKAPKAPDAAAMIEAQTKANQINQITPGGTIEYGGFDEDGVWKPTKDRQTVRVNESGTQGVLRGGREDLAAGLMNRAGTIMDNPNAELDRFFTPSQLQYALPNASQFINNLPTVGRAGDVLNAAPKGGNLESLGIGLPSLNTNYADQNQRAADAVYKRGMNFYEPDFATARDRTNSDLAARGISTDSDAYRAELDRLDRNQAQQRENLALSAIGAGNQEAARLFGQDVTARGQLFGEQANTFGLAEGQAGRVFGQGITALSFDEQQRQNRMQEQQAQLAAALSKQGFLTGLEDRNYAADLQGEQSRMQQAQLAAALGTGNPMFVNPPGVDAAGITQQAYQNQANAQQNSANNLLGLGQLGLGAWTAFSDSRLKENIELVDQKDGINVYEFNYIDQPKRYRGVMAQEVQHLDGVVHEDENGYLKVDYSKLPVDFEEVA